jgi:hypothetical protein
MQSRARTVWRWTLGTLVFGAALFLLDISMYHFGHLRRPRTAPAEWHLQLALGAGVPGLVLLWWGARLVRRWSQDAGAQPTGEKATRSRLR